MTAYSNNAARGVSRRMACGRSGGARPIKWSAGYILFIGQKGHVRGAQLRGARGTHSQAVRRGWLGTLGCGRCTRGQDLITQAHHRLHVDQPSQTINGVIGYVFSRSSVAPARTPVVLFDGHTFASTICAAAAAAVASPTTPGRPCSRAARSSATSKSWCPMSSISSGETRWVSSSTDTLSASP